jgi:hypothetical protein
MSSGRSNSLGPSYSEKRRHYPPNTVVVWHPARCEERNREATFQDVVLQPIALSLYGKLRFNTSETSVIQLNFTWSHRPAPPHPPTTTPTPTFTPPSNTNQHRTAMDLRNGLFTLDIGNLTNVQYNISHVLHIEF